MEEEIIPEHKKLLGEKTAAKNEISMRLIAKNSLTDKFESEEEQE